MGVDAGTGATPDDVQDAAIARLEAKVAELEATVARLGGSDHGAVPAWGTPSQAHVVDADQVTDAVDGASQGTPKRHVMPGRRADRDEGSDEKSTAEQVDEVCHHIASRSRTAGSTSVWLSGRAWQVLGVADSSALLLADQVVCERPYNRYHETRVAVTWERCDLRRWLNGEFCTSLGGPLLSRVLTAKVPNEPNPVNGTFGSWSTKDRVFLLSISEAARYFTGKEPAAWQDYRGRFLDLGSRGTAKDERGERAWWWLRSPGGNPDHAAYVSGAGHLDAAGSRVSHPGGVRPAFWLDLQSWTW
ncbi:MAG: DUF6273 domain-containing protein [Micrococcales bacterium]|nr:DUF6273 domain-containing protein [Micrococcales bacterium]